MGGKEKKVIAERAETCKTLGAVVFVKLITR